jgi:hypothetical protein
MKLFTAMAILGSAAAMCPGDSPCSGKGSCGAFDKCTCYAGYTGQDCSLRTCNHHTSWNVITRDAIDTNNDKSAAAHKLVKHSPTECSSKGECDRDSGECKCFDGYTGKGCRRMACDGGSTCSGHGQCRTLADKSIDEGWTASGIAGYDGWDKSMMQVCKCDPGWEGVSCSERMCPRGDDPLTTGQTSGMVFLGLGKYSQGAATDGEDATGGAFTLTYTDSYGRPFTTFPIDATTVTRIAVKEALEALPNFAIPSVTVTTEAGTQNSLLLKIEFTDDRNTENVPTITVNDDGCSSQGCQNVFTAITSSTGGKAIAALYTSSFTVGHDSATKAIVYSVGTKEHATCSNRGSCDGENGMCECFDGYTGTACQTQTVIM